MAGGAGLGGSGDGSGAGSGRGAGGFGLCTRGSTAVSGSAARATMSAATSSAAPQSSVGTTWRALPMTAPRASRAVTCTVSERGWSTTRTSVAAATRRRTDGDGASTCARTRSASASASKQRPAYGATAMGTDCARALARRHTSASASAMPSRIRFRYQLLRADGEGVAGGAGGLIDLAHRQVAVGEQIDEHEAVVAGRQRRAAVATDDVALVELFVAVPVAEQLERQRVIA